MKIVADRDIPFVKQYFGHCDELVLEAGALINNQLLQDAHMLVVRSATKVNAELLQGTRVKFVGSVTSGTDHLAIDWLTSKGIKWYAATGYNAVTVADYVMAVIAALDAKSAVLPKWRVGIVGVGCVGSIVAARFKKLACEVLLYDPPLAQRDPSFLSCTLDDLATVDLLSIHAPLIVNPPEPTKHLISGKLLNNLAKNSILINAGRGSIIDSAALQQPRALRYCFDVWEHEPAIDVALVRQTTIATPHIAGHSLQSQYRGIAMVYNAAIKSGIIQAQPNLVLPEMPKQILSFAGQELTWQQVLLSIFDPQALTRGMHASAAGTTLAVGQEFSKLRQQYLGIHAKRHDFAATSISEVSLTPLSRYVLEQLAINIR